MAKKFHGTGQRYPGGKSGWLQDNAWAIPVSQNPPKFLETFSKNLQQEQRKQFFKIAKVLEDGDESRGELETWVSTLDE